MDVEVLKRLLREVVVSDPAFFRDLLLDVIRGDGRVVEAIIDLVAKNPEARLRLTEAIAGVITIPLNVATKDDVNRIEGEIRSIKEEINDVRRSMVTREEVKALRDDATALKDRVTRIESDVKDIRDDIKNIKDDIKNIKDDIKRIWRAVSDIGTTLNRLTTDLEDSGRDWVTYFLSQRGYKCTAERLWVDLDGVHEIDIYCNAGVITVIGEVKVRVGADAVDDVYGRVQEVLRRYPDKVSGKLVPVIYALVVEPTAEKRARELGVWVIESRREKVALEEVLSKP
ncbi:MAG: hypothetical protein RXQ97_06655 [Caldivirga sp.]